MTTAASSSLCQGLSLLAALSIAKERERTQRDCVEDYRNLVKSHPSLRHPVMGAGCGVRIVEQEEVVERIGSPPDA